MVKTKNVSLEKQNKTLFSIDRLLDTATVMCNSLLTHQQQLPLQGYNSSSIGQKIVIVELAIK